MWLSYGLGSSNDDLPAFVVMVTGQYPGAGNSLFGNGFLPSIHQGVEFRSQGDPVCCRRPTACDARSTASASRANLGRAANAARR